MNRARQTAMAEKLEGRRLLSTLPWYEFGTTEVSARQDHAAIEVTADGHILVTRNGFLHRFNRAYQPDPTFGGGDGVVETPSTGIAGARFPGNIVDIKIVAGGKILLAGQSSAGAGESIDFTLARLNPDGSLDTTFGGSAKGYVSTAAGIAWADFGDVDVTPDAMAVAPDGRIAIVGDDDDNSAVVAVFNADGSADTGFDTDGKFLWAAKVVTATSEAGTAFDGFYGRAVGFLPDGRLVVGGFTETGFDVNPGFNVDFIPDRDWILKSLTPAGAIDWTMTQLTGITPQGVQQQGGIEDLAVLANGSILAAGSANKGWRVAKFNSTGGKDRTFGDDGERITGQETAFDARNTATRIAVDPEDGSYVLLGSQRVDFAFGTHVAIARFTADGAVDEPFAGAHRDIYGRFQLPDPTEDADAADLVLRGDDPVVLLSSTDVLGEPALRLVYARPFDAPHAFIDDKRVLRIVGSDADDVLHVHRRTDGRTVVVINDFAQSFPTRKFRRIHMLGSFGDDRLTAGRRVGDIYIDGGNGNDFVQGQSGNDLLAGGNGDDTLIGNAGNDRLLGQVGRDLLHGSAGNDSLFGQLGIDTLHGDAGNDFLHGENDTNDNIYGGAGDDIAVRDDKDSVMDVETTQLSGTPS